MRTSRTVAGLGSPVALSRVTPTRVARARGAVARGVIAGMGVFVGLGVMGGMAGCAGPGVRVLVPAADGREARVVTLPPDWAASTVRALRASPGCTGVELSQTQSGKRVIFAMFKDRASVVAWYRSTAHQSMVGLVSFYRDHEHTPAANIAPDAGPILVVATMTPTPPTTTTTRAPTESTAGTVLLSVELFAPLPGGVRFGDASFLPR